MMKKKKCLEGEEAENAFHNEVKKECYIFYQHCDEVLLIKDASLLHMDDIYGVRRIICIKGISIL